ncbi:AraC family transcriptional regulator [Devosia pacifica]|uniref:AraC family transcriptional regulator n=1 Tax=Devosia pacifica TaxID=1335967 RepID=A0A918S3V6_9HYPH|nr:AraC family transcriptional regulator [Devosia pacifica]GHA21608.1 AraC family transcriptional regulator [Devosia pacifica]
MDPLSQVLALLKPSSYGFRGLDAGGDWSLAFAPADGVNCFAIQSGQATIALNGTEGLTELGAGDLVLLPGRLGFRLYGGAETASIDAETFFSSFPIGETGTLNGGGSASGVGGFFGFNGLHAGQLLGILPPIVHIRSQQTRATLSWLIDRLMRELREPQPGGTLIAGHLAQTLLIESLRLHLAERSDDSTGWLFALADTQMRRVIGAMYADPARRWTLAELAAIAGMSRSSFAVRFKDKVGEPAMNFLTRWRMLIAADKLANQGATVARVATMVGYDSESAFRSAFKRIMGEGPRQFSVGRKLFHDNT